MTNNIEKLNSEELEREYLNYYSYINSIGIHGAEKQKAILDFIFSATQKAFQAGQERKAESLREEIMIEIQKDLDAGGFYRICSNESSFKHYVSGLLSTPNNKQNG